MENDLIGRKVRAIFEDVQTGLLPHTYTRRIKRVDPAFIEEIRSMYVRFRIKLPGGVYTADYDPDRANIHLLESDDEFVVTSVTFG